MATKVYPPTMKMMMIWASWTLMTMKMMVLFIVFQFLLWLVGPWSSHTRNFAGKKSADLQALNESLHDLLDGIQVS